MVTASRPGPEAQLLDDGAQASAPPHPDADRTPEHLGSLLRRVGSVVAPTTLLTSLLYYFGFAHSAAFLRYFGLDISLLGLSTQDYMMQSVDALFVPLVVSFTVGLVTIWGHARLATRWREAPDAHRRLRLAARVLALAGTVLFAIGVSGIFIVDPPASYGLEFPLSCGSGTLLLAYASRLQARSATSGPARPGVRSTVLLEVTSAFLLVSLSLFWAATNYAAAVGRTRARQFEQQVQTYPEAIVYSKESLHLDAPGVRETSCAEPPGGYRFRYEGLRLMIRSAGQYFFLPDGWSTSSGVALVVPESDAVRLQFLAPGSRGQAPTAPLGLRCEGAGRT